MEFNLGQLAERVQQFSQGGFTVNLFKDVAKMAR